MFKYRLTLKAYKNKRVKSIEFREREKNAKQNDGNEFTYYYYYHF